MLYAFPILIAAMLGFIFWRAGISMRRDRILSQRSTKRADEAAIEITSSKATRP
jgi:predicted small integral membrane protein